MRLVLDWDGTVTETDSLWMVLDRFGDRAVFERVEGRLVQGTISYRELMEVEFATVRAPLGAVVAYLVEHVRLRAGFHELVRAHRPTILSSGFEELIRPVLAREGIEVGAVANRIDARSDGWRVLWRDATTCEHCGDLCKRGGLPSGEVVFVGDGHSDRCAARAATRVFARAGLADDLAREGVPFTRFDDFRDVLAAL